MLAYQSESRIHITCRIDAPETDPRPVPSGTSFSRKSSRSFLTQFQQTLKQRPNSSAAPITMMVTLALVSSLAAWPGWVVQSAPASSICLLQLLLPLQTSVELMQ